MATYGPTGVAAGGDDYWHSNAAVFTDGTALRVGVTSGITHHSAMRFLGVDIAGGTTISSATIDLRSLISTTGSGTLLTKICAVDENDPAAATTAATCNTDDGIRTTTKVDWDPPFEDSDDTLVTTGNFATVIQELNDSGFTDGSVAVLSQIIDDGNTARQDYASYDNAYTEPRLTIANGVPSVEGAAALSTTSTPVTAGLVVALGTATLSTTSTVVAAGDTFTPPIVSGAAALATTSTPTAAGIVVAYGESTLTTTSTLTTDGLLVVLGTATLSITSTLSADGLLLIVGAAALTVTSTITAGLAGYAVTIGGTAAALIPGTLTVDDAVGERSIASFDVDDEGAAFLYQRSQPVVITRLSDVTVRFSGYVLTDTRERVGTGDLIHRVRATDMTYLADKRIVTGSYTAQTIRAIALDLITNFFGDEGVTGDATTIDEGPTVTETFVYINGATALDRLAEHAGMWWNIDSDKVLHLRYRTAVPAPWTIDAGDFEKYSEHVVQGNRDYRNVQWLIGGTDTTGSQVEIFAGDGTRPTFSVGYPINAEPTIEVKIGAGAYTAKTVGIRGLETGFDWYWNRFSGEVTQDTGGTPLGTADLLRVTYIGVYDMVVSSTDTTEIAALAALEGGGSGKVEAALTRPVVGRTQGFELAAAVLNQYGGRHHTITFDTFRDGLEVGQLATLNLPGSGLDATDMLIIRITWRNVGYLERTRYTVTAEEGPPGKGWTGLFRWLIERGDLAGVDVSTVGTVAQLDEVSESWAWAETSVAETRNACPFPSATTYPDTTLYPC